MWSFAIIVNKLFTILLLPFRLMHPLVGLLVISIVTGILMVWLFGKTSDQNAIHKYKNRLKAHIAEIWLFRDDLIQMLLAVVRVLGNTGIYFLNSLRPLVFMFIPILIVMVMLGVRYEHRPFHAGDTATVASVVSDAAWTRGDAVSLIGSEGVEVISPPLRIPQLLEINWKIRLLKPGIHTITLQTPNGLHAKDISVIDHTGNSYPLEPCAAARGQMASADFLLFPVEPPLPGDSGLESITVKDWPKRDLNLFGLSVNWLIFFFIISMVAGFALKDTIGVEV